MRAISGRCAQGRGSSDVVREALEHADGVVERDAPVGDALSIGERRLVDQLLAAGAQVVRRGKQCSVGEIQQLDGARQFLVAQEQRIGRGISRLGDEVGLGHVDTRMRSMLGDPF